MPPPIDLSAPGWSLHQGQALWRPHRKAPEIAGDLLVAVHPSQRVFIQFSKSPFPLVSAQATPTAWRIEFGPAGRRFSGAGTPPTRLVWFQLPRLLSLEPIPKPWTHTFVKQKWLIQNRRTGEQLEGYLSP